MSAARNSASASSGKATAAVSSPYTLATPARVNVANALAQCDPWRESPLGAFVNSVRDAVSYLSAASTKSLTARRRSDDSILDRVAFNP